MEMKEYIKINMGTLTYIFKYEKDKKNEIKELEYSKTFMIHKIINTRINVIKTINLSV